MPGASRQQATTSLGSGVIVSQDGFVLTNYHVVQAAEAIEVALADGRKDSARWWAPIRTRIWRCSLGSLRNLPTAVLAPDKGLRVGDVVLAIGNPFGVGQTTTQGIVSALGRNGLGLNTYEHFIQTDAAINPGNSGGALVDAQGSLVGINTAIYSESGGSMGIGFATPIDIARRVMDEIVKTGQVKRGWLGIEPQDITPELARAFQLERDAGGVIIAGVLRDGPAARAGLRVGDIVQSVNGKPMTSTNGLLAEIAQLPTGERARLGLLRGGKRSELESWWARGRAGRARDGRGSDGSVVWTVRRGRSAVRVSHARRESMQGLPPGRRLVRGPAVEQDADHGQHLLLGGVGAAAQQRADLGAIAVARLGRVLQHMRRGRAITGSGGGATPSVSHTALVSSALARRSTVRRSGQ